MEYRLLIEDNRGYIYTSSFDSYGEQLQAYRICLKMFAGAVVTAQCRPSKNDKWQRIPTKELV